MVGRSRAQQGRQSTVKYSEARVEYRVAMVLHSSVK